MKVAQSCPTLCQDSPGQNTGVGCHAFFQEIFPTQGLNPSLPHCRRILYHLSHQGSYQGSLSLSLPNVNLSPFLFLGCPGSLMFFCFKFFFGGIEWGWSLLWTLKTVIIFSFKTLHILEGYNYISLNFFSSTWNNRHVYVWHLLTPPGDVQGREQVT